MTPKCRTQNQASCLLCKARGGFCIDKLYNPPHTEGILALPDLIALSWSLYALSQDKNDPNTNPEIITCSRKDIFVDISWITAKKIFFFFFFAHSSFQSFATDTAKIVWESSEMTQTCPSKLLGRCTLTYCCSAGAGEEQVSRHVLPKEQKRGFKNCLVVYVCS